MARKRPAVVVESGPGRIVSFRAPDTIHGAIKQIVGKLEMGSLKIDGKSPSGQDVLTWLVADLYTAGDDQWAKRVDEAHRRYLDLVSRN
jgi:hypothetical protein